MLEAMRKNSRSVIIYVLFGVIIAAFLISFGPGSRGMGSGGSSTGASYAAKVGGTTISEQDFHFSYMAITRGGQVPPEAARTRRLKEQLMDKLIEGELFAQEAERLGFEVSEEEAAKMIVDGRLVLLGVPRRMSDDPFFAFAYKDGSFDRDHFKLVVQNQLGVSEKRFVDVERRELLADKVRELLKVGLKVDADEVKKDFEQHGTQVNLEFARFSGRRLEDESEVPPADLDAYVKAHEAELKKQFEERAFLYKKTDKQVRLRTIQLELPKDAKPAQVAAVQKQLSDALAKVKAGTPFAELARQLTSEEHLKKRGGLLGWRKKGFTALPPALEEKVFAAKKGALIGPERTPTGFALVDAEEFREGDIPFAEAARELAEQAVRTERGKAQAKAEAQGILARLKKGEKFEVLVPKENPTEAQDDKQQKAITRRFNEKPQLAETGLFWRKGDQVQEVGVSSELAKRAFELKLNDVDGPFAVGDGWVIVRVKERKEADMADFEKRKDEILREAARTKWTEVLDQWAKQRCIEARDEGHIRVNDEVLAYEGATQGREIPKYQPCAPQPKMF